MDAGALNPDTAADLPRAGFWRRWLAIVIDTILVSLPFQFVAAVLFAATSGAVQMYGGLTYLQCDSNPAIPQSLNPPPPHDSNFARICHTYLFGAPTGTVLTVGRATRESNRTTTVSQGYMLDNEDKPIDGTSIDWVVELALLAYLVGMISRTGRTVGSRVAGVRVIDTARPERLAIPVGKAIGRYLAMMIGVLPMMAVIIYRWFTDGEGGADAMFTGDFFRWFLWAALAAAAWTLVLIYQIVFKTDPFYDRLAGTAVVKM